MKTHKQLYDKYLADVVALQRKCTHKNVSDWMEEQWAPAHSTGFEVKVCEICGVVISRRTGNPEFFNAVVTSS